jgi:hypothetical protein
MPKSLGSLHASRFPMMMDSSFMVPKPAATPAKPKVPVSSVTSGMASRKKASERQQTCLERAGEVMATGFGV